LDENERCIGCGRPIDVIIGWCDLTAAERSAALAEAALYLANAAATGWPRTKA
jgi:predicted Fe-S protein YdhL (DUF1289 family)